MERIERIDEKGNILQLWSNKYIILMSIVNILLVLIIGAAGAFKYEMNDDLAISAIANGCYGSYSAYVVYYNIIYGRILTFLYQYIPSVNWVPVLFIIFSCIAYILIGFVFVKKAGAFLGSIFSYLFLFLTFSDIYEKINFTRISAIICLAGYLFVFFCLEREEIRYRILSVLGCIMIILGSLIRFEVFLMVSAFAFGIFCYQITKSYKKGMGVKGNKFKRYLFFCGVSLIVIFGMQGYHTYVYQSNTEWRNYLQYNKLRSNLLDFGMPYYEEYEQEYNEMGISQADYEMFIDWNYADIEVFSVETLQAIVNMKPKLGIKSVIKKLVIFLTYEIGVRKYLNNSVFLFGLFTFLIYILLNKNRCYFLVIWSGIISFFELFYLYCIQREVSRVSIIPLLCLTAIILYNYNIEKMNYKDIIHKKYVLLSFIVLGFISCNISGILRIAGGFTDYFINKEIKKDNKKYIDFFEDSVNSDNYYIWDPKCFAEISYAYGMFDVPVFSALSNSNYTGGWTVPSPIFTESKKNHNIKNVFEALVYDPKVFLVENAGIDLKLKYLRSHYEDDIEYSLFKNQGYDIYSFSPNYRVTDKKERKWNIKKNTEKNNDNGLYKIEGEITDADADYYYLEVRNLAIDACHTYQINVQNNEFIANIHFNKCRAGDVFCIKMIEIKDNRFYYAGEEKRCSIG